MTNIVEARSGPPQKSINILALNKGDYIEPHIIAEVTETKLGTTTYQFGRLHLALQLRLEAIEAGRPMVFKGEGDGLRVLTDDEAVDYLSKAHERHLRGMCKALEDLNGVDTSRLGQDMLNVHRIEVVRQSRIWQAIQAEAKALQIEGYSRRTPPMLEE